MTSRLKLAMLAAFAGLAVVAVIGWTRHPAPVAAYSSPAAATTYTAEETATATPSAAPATYESQPVQTYTATSPADPCAQAPAEYGSGYATPAAYAGYPAPSYQRRYSVRAVRTRVAERGPVTVSRTRVARRHKRSLGKSIAIVAGSAGVGAGIGALAGGGNGAGIGALAGGAGGFVYDRLTHKR